VAFLGRAALFFSSQVSQDSVAYDFDLRSLVVVIVAACACPTKPPAPPATAGSGAATAAASCEDLRHKVEQLYRAEAEVAEPRRVDDATADNTAMVMTECAKDRARVVPCLDRSRTIAEIEKQCLAPLDDEGTEGDHP